MAAKGRTTWPAKLYDTAGIAPAQPRDTVIERRMRPGQVKAMEPTYRQQAIGATLRKDAPWPRVAVAERLQGATHKGTDEELVQTYQVWVIPWFAEPFEREPD